MKAPYAPSLVWVCLACGQLSPYHANPSDFIDSANAMDLPLVVPSVSSSSAAVSPIHLPSTRASAATTTVVSRDEPFRSPSEVHHSANALTLDRDSLGAGNGDDDPCAELRLSSGTAAAADPCHRCAHHDQSTSCEDAPHSCLLNESDSSVSMATVSHHQQRRQQGQLRQHQQASSSSSSSPAVYESHRPRSGHPEPYHAPSVRKTNTEDSMQSFAALLMEEHLVGSREMRFCEGCREVRCSEIRKASDVLSHAAAASGREAGGGNVDHAESMRALPSHSHHVQIGADYRETGFYPSGSHAASNGDPAASAFLYVCDEPSHMQSDGHADYMDPEGTLQLASPCTLQQADQPLSPSSSLQLPRSNSPAYSSFASATRCGGDFQGKREVPSGHLVVALAVARMLGKLKSVAVTVMHNLNPLTPSLPTARRCTSSDVDEEREQQQQRKPPRRSSIGKYLYSYHKNNNIASERAPPFSPASTTETTPSCYEPVAKSHPQQFASSRNSSLDETAVVGEGGDSNGISFNSFSTIATMPSPQAQPPPQSQADWSGDDFNAPVDHELSSTHSPACVPTYAQLLFLRDATADFSCMPASGDAASVTAAGGAFVRACKEKWNSLSISEALWRLVLPSFSPPFLGGVQATRWTSPSHGGSFQSAPHRAGSGSGFDGQPKPYRGFRGEVENAVTRLDSMQLEVAKLRLEQVLAEVTAEQTRRARDGSA